MSKAGGEGKAGGERQGGRREARWKKRGKVEEERQLRAALLYATVGEVTKGGHMWAKLKEFFLGVLEIPYISRELSEMQRPLLLHVSDTPSMSYTYLGRLLRRLEPEYLIHTGDMVDDVKLELAPRQVDEYREKLRRFLAILQERNFRGAYLLPGNHDSRAVVEELGFGEYIVRDGTTVYLQRYRFRLDHDYRSFSGEADFHLYGHTPDVGSNVSASPARLNGIEHIHVISLKDGTVHTLPYPAGTDSARKMLMLKVGM